LATTSSWSQTRLTQGATKQHTVRLKTGEPVNAKYTWTVTPSTGTSSNLALFEGTSANLLWAGPIGSYTLAVQVVDGNGCLSEAAFQDIEIVAAGDLLFSAAYPNTIVCSDLAGGNEGSVPEHSQSLFEINYAGDTTLLEAIVTIKNPNGIFVGLDGTALPDQQSTEVLISNQNNDKVIEISVSDSWENNTSETVLFTITLVSVKTADQVLIQANEQTDVIRTIGVLPKPNIEFE